MLTDFEIQQLTNLAECHIHTHPERVNYTFPHGGFSDDTDQSASANTATAMEFNTTDVSDGVEVQGSPPTKIYVPQDGVYNVQFSAQFVNTNTPAVNISIWLAVDGANLDNSCTFITVHEKHAGGDGYGVGAWNWFVRLNRGQYVEIYWSTPSTAVTIDHIPAQVSPTRPATPSVILTVSFVSD